MGVILITGATRHADLQALLLEKPNQSGSGKNRKQLGGLLFIGIRYPQDDYEQETPFKNGSPALPLLAIYLVWCLVAFRIGALIPLWRRLVIVE